ncbi:MAG TPA: LrgB family protein [Burkholderiales bacterium]|nr:LrgB family protein [Burkholderiales bacterium]
MKITLFCVALTVGAYVVSRFAARRYPSPLTTPVFFSTALIVALLLLVGVDSEEYRPAKDVLVFLLAPATVALAIPIYKNRGTLLTHLFPAMTGIVAGCLSTIVAAVLIGGWLEMDGMVVASLSVKSVTAPIAVELAALVHANPALAAVFVIVTGMVGAMLGPWLMNIAGIAHPLARGVALGTISHGQGTAQAVSEGELQGAIAGIAMGASAVLTSIGLPVTLWMLG